MLLQDKCSAIGNERGVGSRLQKRQSMFNPWLTSLRIDEAKRLLREHPDWSNDTIAQLCGFSSRSYFQNVFRKQTGITPAQFAHQPEIDETAPSSL